MYLLGAALGAAVAVFLLSRLLIWVLRKAHVAGRVSILAAHGASLAIAAVAGCVGFPDAGSLQVAVASALYAAATAIFLVADLVTYRRSWWRRPVYQVI
jgi:hypothetical protein